MTLEAYASGSTEPWTVSVLQALVRLTRPEALLELGTFEGRTTRALASVMSKHATLCTVDLQKRFAEPFEDRRIHFHAMDAIEFLRRNPTPWHFAFVDDDHDAAHVAEELDLLLACMAPGGLIVGHDVLGPFNLAPLFVERGGFIIELPHLHAAGSLGVIALSEELI